METKTLGAIGVGLLAAVAAVALTTSTAPAPVVDEFAAKYCRSYEEQKSDICREHWNTPADAGVTK